MIPPKNPGPVTPQHWVDAIQLLADHADNPILDRLAMLLTQARVASLSAEGLRQLDTNVAQVLGALSQATA